MDADWNLSSHSFATFVSGGIGSLARGIPPPFPSGVDKSPTSVDAFFSAPSVPGTAIWGAGGERAVSTTC